MRRKITDAVRQSLFSTCHPVNNVQFDNDPTAERTEMECFLEEDPPSYDVFLGGTCNDLKWRENLVIPALRELGVSFFNPVVKEWSTDCVISENQAKNNSRLLLFYLDPGQLSPASLIEITYLGCSTPDRVIAVIPDEDEGFAKDPLIDASRHLVRTILSRFPCQISTSLEGTVAKLRSKWRRWWLLHVKPISSDLLDECLDEGPVEESDESIDYDDDDDLQDNETVDEGVEDGPPVRLLVNKASLVEKLEEQCDADVFVPDDFAKEVEDPSCDMALFEITPGEEENLLFYVQAAALVARMVPLILLLKQTGEQHSESSNHPPFEKRCQAYLAEIASQVPELLAVVTLNSKESIMSKIQEFYQPFSAESLWLDDCPS